MPRRLPNYFRADQVEQLVAVAGCERDRVLVQVLFGLGLRVSEADRKSVV